MGSYAVSKFNIALDYKINNNATSSISFSSKGLKLSYILNEFYELVCNGKDNIINSTTAEINDIYLKKITEEDKLSYCEYLTNLNHHAVGEANVFISHAWKYKFVDVMDALEYHFKDNLDVIIWFDLFSNNQHIAPDLDFNWWCDTFKSAIGNFKHTVMVLCPWNNPIPLTRAWCIWELYCTIKTKSKFDIALSKQNQQIFLNDILTKGATNEINHMLATIDSENSQSFKPEDKKNIFDIVKKEVGFNIINSMIFGKMRDWVTETTESFMKNEENEINRLKLMNILAVLYRNQGKYVKAEPMFINCLEIRRNILGENDINTLNSVNNLADLYSHQKKYKKAEALYLECLIKRKEILGEYHSDTIVSINNLANLYNSQQRYEEAEPLYVDCLVKSKEILGEKHFYTFACMNNLANLYDSQQNYDLAEPLYIECFDNRKEFLGKNNPETLSTMYNLACLYSNQGNFVKAKPLYVECLTKQKAELGENHPDTLETSESLILLNFLYNES